MHRSVHQAGDQRELVRDVPQQRQPSHHVVRRRTQTALVVLVEELCLVRRHIHVHRAFRGTCLTGQAQVQSFLDLRRPVAVSDGLAPEHLREDPGATAGRMYLVAGDLEGRAHRAFVTAARRDAHATVDRVDEVTLVFAESVDRGDLEHALLRVHPQSLGNLVRPDQHTGVEDPVRVEDELELLEQAPHLR